MAELDTRRIKGYELRERIGTGGFGAVYRAYQPTIGREVAVKIILSGHANQPAFIRRFETEAQIIARLEHLHIVPLYDYWRDPEGAYLVMRFMRGGSLQDTLANGPYDLEAAALLLDQVAAALTVAHRSSIIHRDIKPANILLDEDGNAYLTDFSIAKDLSGAETMSDRSVGALVGSPDYISPEQTRSAPVSPQTDIYSLGVVLYETLAGEHPFPNMSTVERIYKHLNDPLPELAELDESVRAPINAVIQQATAKNPAQRFEDVVRMARAFREAAGLGISRTDLSAAEMLTPREQEVLALMVKGQSNREIAEKLTVELTTVKWYLRQLYRKLGVRSRVQAIVRAQELELVLEGKVKKAVTTTGLRAMPEPDNPYKGLRAFQIADEQDFFGREKLIKRLSVRVGEDGPRPRFLSIVGPSGSGKSSLVKAGLVPALWRGALPGSEEWYIVEMVPGAHPLDELEVALMRIAAKPELPLREQLQRDGRGLIRAAQLILPDKDTALLLVVDQFEEVFTLVEDEAARVHFLDLLAQAATDPRSRVRVILTLRADFYDRPLHYPDFGKLVQARTETVLPLSAEELERAIRCPAERVGVHFEEGLVPAIIEDVHYQPGALPLLQYALTELFEQREGRVLTRDAYQKIGGAVGALAQRAEALYGELRGEDQESARQMYLRLVSLGEEAAPDTRRRVHRSELLAVAAEPDLMDDLIDTYAAYRLLSLDSDPETRSPTVEIAHEALLREWGRLRGWLDESREDLRLQRQLARTAEEWRGAEEDNSFLLRGTRLDVFAVWAGETSLALTPAERRYLQESLLAREERQAEETARQARERRLEQRARIVLIGLVGVLVVAAGVSTWLAVRAISSEQEALRQASVGLAAQSREVFDTDMDLSVLLALEALEHYPYSWQAESALAEAVEGYVPSISLKTEDTTGANFVAWSPDGSQIVRPDAQIQHLHLVQSTTGNTTVTIDLYGVAAQYGISWITASRIEDVDWSPDGSQLAVAFSDSAGTVVQDTGLRGFRIYEVNTGQMVFDQTGFVQGVLDVEWSSDGERLLTAGADGKGIIWETATGEQVQVLSGHEGPINSAQWSPNGLLIATASEDGAVRIWEARSGIPVRKLDAHAGAATDLDWSPGGSQLAVSYIDGAARIWSAGEGIVLTTFTGHTDAINDIDWSPQGDRIASVGVDGFARIWNPVTGKEVLSLLVRGQTSRVSTDIGWSPAGDQLAVGSHVDLWIWDLAALPVYLPFQETTVDAQWSPDGRIIIGTGLYEKLAAFDTRGREIYHIDIRESSYFDWAPDGQRLVMGPSDTNQPTIWNAATGALLQTLSSPRLADHVIISASWSPDGTRIASPGWALDNLDHAGVIWDARTGETITILENQHCHLHRPNWSPDSQQLITGCLFPSEGQYPGGNTPAFIWDTATGDILATLESENGTTFSGEWSPDGTQIVTTHGDGTVRIWDAETQEETRLLTGLGADAWDAEWSPAGTRIAAGDGQGNVIIWNAESGDVIQRFQVSGQVLSVHWHPDGTHVIVSGGGLTTPVIHRAWESTEALIADAYECCVTRDLTPAEREQFGLPEQ